MPQMIASTYEIIGHIGSGGGGDVYLARHVRLNKKVVLKADKRTLKTRPELLRREVDVLKNLSHSYIPKVYDFFVENDTVYTAMDYIEGESLDKPLKRGERFTQPQVIKWAKQLLQALCYLHSPTHGDPPRGFVHSDIKPANLMLTPYGDICLIDFNISLALGEVNFVGYSAGYASPEHYGLDYSEVPAERTSTRTAPRFSSRTRTSSKTFDANAPTQYMGSGSVSINGKKTVRPDVRSDIYSTGAVMYHLLSGKRPASSALEVEPLSGGGISPLLAEIIAKAMSPNPGLRYQTAAEMLRALERLHQDDPRVKRSRRAFAISEACMCALLAAGVFTAFVGLKRIQGAETSLKLAEYSVNALREGDRRAALEYALQSFPEKPGLFTPEPSAQAISALAGGTGVYDLSDGYKAYRTMDIGSAALSMELSPDGETLACVCSGRLLICSMESGAVTVELPAEDSALSQAKFLDDNAVIFAGNGALSAYDINRGEYLWTGERATSVSISGDKRTAAAVWRDAGYAVVYDAATGRELSRVDFGGRKQSVRTNDRFADPHDNLFSLSADGSLLAVSFDDGTLSVFSVASPEDSVDIFGQPNSYTHFEGGFSGQYLAFSAADSSGSVFAVIDCVNWEQTGGFQSESLYSVHTDDSAILVQTDNILVKLDPVTGENTPLIDTAESVYSYAYDGTRAFVSTAGGTDVYQNAVKLSHTDMRGRQAKLAIGGEYAVSASADSGEVRILRFEGAGGSGLFSYDPAYSHDEARISPDGQRLMMFGNDRFMILDRDGETVCSADIPEPDQIYDQQYVRSGGGAALEVIYYSGKTLVYSGADGSLLREEQREKPDPSLTDEFLTDKLRIEAPLHGQPQVYDRSTGKLVAQLGEDAYLAYVTQTEDGVICQYAATDGSFYGVLMNDSCEELARMPYLCDVNGSVLFFDIPTGNIRSTRVYKSSELIEIAHEKEGEYA